MAIYLHCPRCKSGQKITSKICKCGYKFPTQGKKYRVVVSANGKRQSKTLPNLTQARNLESKWKGQVIDGDYNLKVKRVLTVQECWDAYYKNSTKKTIENDLQLYRKHLKPVFGAMPMDRITDFTVKGFIKKMQEKRFGKDNNKTYSVATQKHVVGVLSRVFNNSAYKSKNPCADITFTLNNTIVEQLTEDETQSLIAVLEKWPNRMSACFVSFLLYTGLRRGELFKLQWINIDFDKCKMTLVDPKGKKDAVLPVSALAMGVIAEAKAVAELHGIESEYIFYGKDGGMRTDFAGPWKRIKKEAKIPMKFRLHGLRHHFASQLVQAGVPIYTVSKLLTHKDVKTTERYAHLADETLADAVNISDTLNKATAQKVPTKVVNMK